MSSTPSTALIGNAALLQQKNTLIAQTNKGPSLDEVAAKVLREALAQRYRDLAINPDHTLVVTPQWKWRGEVLTAGHPHVESLTQTLIRQSVFSQVANFIEGEHFLTPAPLSASPLHLAVCIEDIANVLNDCAPLLFLSFQQQQLDFWNESVDQIPRWHTLSDTLQKALNVQAVHGWDADQCAVARAVSAYPDKAERAKNNTTMPGIQACLIDLDATDAKKRGHLLTGGALVLKAAYQEREILLLYTVEEGYETFDSLDALGASLPARIDMASSGQALQWRLYEPDGNIFDHMAWALISSQVTAIAALKQLPASGTPPFNGGVRNGRLSAEEKAHIDTLEAAVPQWLARASAADMQAYGECLSNQGRLRSSIAANAIPLIAQYAQDQLRTAIVADKQLEGSRQLPLDELQIAVTSSFTVGAFTLPDTRNVQIESLGAFALQNTAPYQAALHFKNHLAVPDWLTVAYLNRMATQVNIGKHYPLLLKNELIDDQTKAQQQQARYVALLPDLLKLNALECKLRGESGIDETGYQYVCDLMNVALGKPRSLGVTVVIRPLTFVPRHRLLSTGDTVANMFIISAREYPTGVCLLYRPLLEQPLQQFASVANLMYAVHQPAELRDSVLAWLPTPALSFEYAQYVFPVGLPSPWLATETGFELLFNLDLSGPISLGTEEVAGDLLPALYASNASTLIEQADRQSLSNGERRWALLRDSGWAIFSNASTFLTGPVGTAVWVWQSIEQLQQGLDAHERGDGLVQWTSLGDVLMTLGMVLIHKASQRRHSSRLEQTPEAHRTRPPERSPVPTTIVLDPTPITGELPSAHASLIETAQSVPRRAPSALGVYLDSIKVPAPNLKNQNLVTINETPPHLYQLDDKQYAQVGERWFQVHVDNDDQVQIINPVKPESTGPLLTQDRAGNWYVDTRLRLRGGGPKNRLKALLQQKEARKETLQTHIEAFKLQEATLKQEVEQLQNALLQASPEQFDAHATPYIDKLDDVITRHREALEQLSEWRTLGGTVGYTYNLLRLTTLLEKYLALWFTVKTNQYARTIAPLAEQSAINTAAPVGTNLELIRKASELSQAIVERITLAHGALDGLKVLGRAGSKESRALTNLLPRLTPEHFKANEIGMSYELCVQETSDPLMPQARAAIADLVIDAAEASHEVADLMKRLSVTDDPEEPIRNLSRLSEVYTDALARLNDLPAQYPGMLQPTALDHLQTLIRQFQRQTQHRLTDLLPETVPPVVQPSPAPQIAGPSRPTIKVSKTRPRDPQVEKTPSPEEPTFEKFLPRSDLSGQPALDDTATVSEALDLEAGVDAFITRTRKEAQRPSRIPADMQHLFEQHGIKLDAAAAGVDKVIANLRAAGKPPLPVANLSLFLRDDALRVKKEGVHVRTSMLKQRKPRQEYLQWLNDNGQVLIERNAQGRIKTRQRRDYFQEYRILDISSQRQELWVAHFHYEALDSPADQPTAAHLKVSDAYLETLDPTIRQQLSHLQPIDYVLRRISAPATRALFLSLEPVPSESTNSSGD